MNSPPNCENKGDISGEIDDLCRWLETITAKIKVLRLQQKVEEQEQEQKRIRWKKKKKKEHRRWRFSCNHQQISRSSRHYYDHCTNDHWLCYCRK